MLIIVILKIWQLYKNLKLVHASSKYTISVAQSLARKAFQIMPICSNAFFFKKKKTYGWFIIYSFLGICLTNVDVIRCLSKTETCVLWYQGMVYAKWKAFKSWKDHLCWWVLFLHLMWISLPADLPQMMLCFQYPEFIKGHT